MKASLLLLGCIALAGCAHYAPQPLAPAAVRQALERRTLDTPEVVAYVRQHAGRAAPPWNVDALTAAAWYYSPELDKARAQAAATAAAEVAAGQRPAATLSIPFEYTTNPKPDESPYTIGAALDLPIETAGKRGLRVANARSLSLAARLDVGAAAWRVRQQLRAQLLAAWDAGVRAQLLQAQLALRERLAAMLERRRALGEVASPEPHAARAQVAATRVKLLQARRDEADALAAAASAIGIPAAALQAQPLDLGAFARPADTPRHGALLDAALRNRADVQADLARYAASQSALQVAVANQYPDIHLGPGYTFDAGAHKIVFGLGGIALAWPRASRGLIAEATARREAAAAQVQATVAAALGEVDRAFATWRPAVESLASARAALVAQERLVRAAEAALRVGEDDRPTLLRAELDAAAARLDVQQACFELQKTVGAMEDAVQRPLAGEAAAGPAVEGRP